MRDACLYLCKRTNGSEMCSCERHPTNYCDAHAQTILGLFGVSQIGVTGDQIKALFEGRATIRLKPTKKPK